VFVPRVPRFGWNLPGIPARVWFFSPFTWRFLFFLGAWVGFGAARPIEPILRSDVVFWIAVGVLRLTLAIVLRAQSGYCMDPQSLRPGTRDQSRAVADHPFRRAGSRR